MKRLILTLVALVSLAGVAHSQALSDVPLVSMKRLSAAIGANYEFTNNPLATSEPVLDRKQEFTAGLYAAYNLTPKLSLASSSVMGLSSRQVRTAVGVRLRVFRGDQ